MNKEKGLKITKILSILIWIILLVVPTFVSAADKVTYVSDDYVYNEETNAYDFTITCDKEFVKGNVTVDFYDGDGIKQKSINVPFEKNSGKSVTISISENDIPETTEDYIVEEMYVTSKMVSDVNKVIYPIAIFWLVWLLYVLSINVSVCEKDGKKIEVFAGLILHQLKIDGEVAASVKKWIMLKPIVLAAYIGEGLKIFAEINFNKRIVVYSQDAAVDGNEVLDTQHNTIAKELPEAETKTALVPQTEETKISGVMEEPDAKHERDDDQVEDREISEEAEELQDSDQSDEIE